MLHLFLKQSLKISWKRSMAVVARVFGCFPRGNHTSVRPLRPSWKQQESSGENNFPPKKTAKKTLKKKKKKPNLVENLRRLVINQGNNASASRFNEFHVRRRNVRSVCIIVKPAGGAVARMSQNPDHRTEIQLRIRRRATRRRSSRPKSDITREQNRGLGFSSGQLFRDGKQERNPEVVPDLGVAAGGGGG